MKHKKHKIDISEWGIEAIEEINKCLEKKIIAAVEETLECVLNSKDTYIYFPIEFARNPDDKRAGSDGIGGEEVEDPLTVYLRIGLESGGEAPTYELNIREALQNTIDACKVDGSFSTGLSRLSKALKELACNIDSALNETNTNRGNK